MGPQSKKAKLFNYKILKNAHAKQPYHWICVASNGETRCCSENYSQKHNCITAVLNEIRYRVKGVCSFEDCTNETDKISRRVERMLE